MLKNKIWQPRKNSAIVDNIKIDTKRNESQKLLFS
jgi:hypothetical protein